MRIKIGCHTVTVEETQMTTCPAGTAYWQVQYVIDDMVVYTIATGAIYARPNALALLGQDYEHMQLDSKGAKVRTTKTHRQWLTDALNQVAIA